MDGVRQKNYGKALTASEKMVSLGPDNPGAYVYRAVAKRYLRQFASARADLNTALSLAKREGSRDLTAVTFAEFAHLVLLEGRPAEAQDYFRKALRESPNEPSIYNNYAWVMATSRTDAVRNGPEAVKMALKACELAKWSDPSDLDTLAAAYAEAGDFANAVKWQTKAMDLLKGGKDDKRNLADLNSRLTLYKNHQPYRSDK